MTNHSTTIILPPKRPSAAQDSSARGTLMDWFRQRDRVWLLLILLTMAALFLGGCHARSDCCHAHTSCGNSSADGVLAAFYVAYLLGWIIVTAAGG